MASKAGDKNSQIMTYVCLEQPETLEYLNFLKVSQSSNLNGQTIFNFNSEPDEAKSNKKTKKFSFDGIYKRTQKFVNNLLTDLETSICQANKRCRMQRLKGLESDIFHIWNRRALQR